MLLLLVLAILGAFGVSGYIVILLCMASRALGRARDGLSLLEEELDAAHNQRAERYRVRLPSRVDYELERDVSDETFRRLENELRALENVPRLARLKSTWRAECDKLAHRARSKVRALQSEVFWAQFPTGSEAAESRFRKDEDWL